MNDSDWLELNRASWNARTPVHLASRFYDRRFGRLLPMVYGVVARRPG